MGPFCYMRLISGAPGSALGFGRVVSSRSSFVRGKVEQQLMPDLLRLVKHLGRIALAGLSRSASDAAVIA
jgi:hypothetical protein